MFYLSVVQNNFIGKSYGPGSWQECCDMAEILIAGAGEDPVIFDHDEGFSRFGDTCIQIYAMEEICAASPV